MGEDGGEAMTVVDALRTDRLVKIDGSLIYGDLTPEEARTKQRELIAQRISFRHHRWAGDRVGWISVCGHDVGEATA